MSGFLGPAMELIITINSTDAVTEQPPAVAKTRSRSLELILGLLPLVLGFQLIIWMSYLPTALGGHADFRNCYSAGLILRSGRGRQLYDYELQRQIQNTTISPATMVLPYVHLPYEALLFAPFTIFSYRKAFVGFLFLNLVFLFIAFWLWQKLPPSKVQVWRWFSLLFFVGFAPISATLLQGQDSILTLLLFSAAVVSIDSNEMLAGAFLGLALYKFQLVLPIAALFLLWRRWNFLAGSSVSALSALGLSAILASPDGLRQYFLSLHDISTKFTAGNNIVYIMPVSSMPNIRGTLLAIPHLSPGIASGLVIALSIVVFGFAFWSGINVSSRCQLAIAISTTTLVGYHVLMHDLSILLIPMAMLLSMGQRLWTLPLVWLCSPLCFVGYAPVVTVAILVFFFAMIFLMRQGNSSRVEISYASSVTQIR